MTPKPSDSSEIASILYDFRDRPISDPKMLTSEQAKAKLEALVVRGRVEELEHLNSLPSNVVRGSIMNRLYELRAVLTDRGQTDGQEMQ
jgi:hypothetical protein